MKIKKSPLILKEFLLLRQQLEYIEIDGDTKDQRSVDLLFDNYNVDIDFKSERIEYSEGLLLSVRIFINTDKKNEPLTGYSIFIECSATYFFEKNTEIGDEAKSTLFFGSGLSMCINQLRAIIASMTAMYPLGRYILPSIEISQLLKDKKRQQEILRKRKRSKDLS